MIKKLLFYAFLVIPTSTVLSMQQDQTLVDKVQQTASSGAQFAKANSVVFFLSMLYVGMQSYMQGQPELLAAAFCFMPFFNVFSKAANKPSNPLPKPSGPLLIQGASLQNQAQNLAIPKAIIPKPVGTANALKVVNPVPSTTTIVVNTAKDVILQGAQGFADAVLKTNDTDQPVQRKVKAVSTDPLTTTVFPKNVQEMSSPQKSFLEGYNYKHALLFGTVVTAAGFLAKWALSKNQEENEEDQEPSDTNKTSDTAKKTAAKAA